MKKSVLIGLLLISLKAASQHLPYTGHTDAGILVGKNVKPSFSLQTFHGIKIDSGKFEAGVNAGVDIYGRVTLLPVSIGLKWNVLSTKSLTPYLNLNAGYGLTWLQEQNDFENFKGGFMINPSMGLRFNSGNKAKLNLSLGYKQQKASVAQNPQFFNDFMSFGASIKDDYTFKRIHLTAGLSF